MLHMGTSARFSGHSFVRPLFLAIWPGKGVNELTKPARFKVGIVNVKQRRGSEDGRASWELRYFDPLTGHDIKRRVAGLARKEIAAIADNLTREAYQGNGYLAGRKMAPTLDEAFNESVRLARGRQDTKLDYAKQGRKFVGWVSTHYPAVKTWEQLRPVMVQAYVRKLEEKGLAFDTIRLRLFPIKAAWKLVSENHPDLVRPLPRIKQAAPPKHEVECLDFAEVGLLLGWLREHARDVWPIATLQGLCGLRMLEAAALRIQDIDFEARTLTVCDTGFHRPKTRDSYRTIPICGEALEVLRVTTVEQKVKPATGELFVNASGGVWKVGALTLRMIRTLRRAAAKPDRKLRRNGRPLPINENGLDMPRLAAIPAHRLRASFVTMAGRLGVPDRLLKAYIGHASGDILGSHYRRIGLDELRLVSDRMENRKAPAVEASSWKDPGNMEANKVESR